MIKELKQKMSFFPLDPSLFKLGKPSETTDGHHSGEITKIDLGNVSFESTSKGMADFNAYKTNLIATDGNIVTGDGQVIPAHSVAGKALLMKTDLMLNHGIPEDIAQKTANETFGIKGGGLTIEQLRLPPDPNDSPPPNTESWHSADSSSKSMGDKPREYRSPHGPVTKLAPAGSIR